MSTPPPHRRAGLTLIEVMLAVLIIGIGITALVSAASRCLAVARKARHFENARHLLAQVEIEEPLALKEKIEEGSESGSFSGDFSAYRWERTITVVGEEEEDGLYEVDTRVFWSELGKLSSEEISTYLYAPPETHGGSFER